MANAREIRRVANEGIDRILKAATLTDNAHMAARYYVAMRNAANREIDREQATAKKEEPQESDLQLDIIEAGEMVALGSYLVYKYGLDPALVRVTALPGRPHSSVAMYSDDDREVIDVPMKEFQTRSGLMFSIGVDRKSNAVFVCIHGRMPESEEV